MFLLCQGEIEQISGIVNPIQNHHHDHSCRALLGILPVRMSSARDEQGSSLVIDRGGHWLTDKIGNIFLRVMKDDQEITFMGDRR